MKMLRVLWLVTTAVGALGAATDRIAQVGPLTASHPAPRREAIDVRFEGMVIDDRRGGIRDRSQREEQDMFQTKHPHRQTLSAVAFLAAVILVVVTAGGGLAAPAPPFTQCPPVGASPSCAILIEFTDQGINIFEDPLVGPYDGIEDTLVGVVNNSSATVNKVTLSGVGALRRAVLRLRRRRHLRRL
jgi:hypothetical protein